MKQWVKMCQYNFPFPLIIVFSIAVYTILKKQTTIFATEFTKLYGERVDCFPWTFFQELQFLQM